MGGRHLHVDDDPSASAKRKPQADVLDAPPERAVAVAARGLFVKVRGGKVVWTDADGNVVDQRTGKPLAPKAVVSFDDPMSKTRAEYELSPTVSEGMSVEQVHELAAQYHRLDTSRDKALQLDEWLKWTEECGFTNDAEYRMMSLLTQAEREQAFRVWDLDKDGGITFEEYVRMWRGLQGVAHRFDSRKAALLEEGSAKAAEIRHKYRQTYGVCALLRAAQAEREALFDDEPKLCATFWCGCALCPCTLGCSFLPYWHEARVKQHFEADDAARARALDARRDAQEELKSLKARFLEGPSAAQLERG